MLQKIGRTLINFTQVLFGYVGVASILGLLIKATTVGNYDVPYIYLFIIVILVFKISPQLQSLYPFAFRVALRNPRGFGLL